MSDWSPEQYQQFARERAQPFDDLLSLIRPGSFERVVDLGCGPGSLTAAAAERLGAKITVGVDNSPAMLAAAGDHARKGVSFRQGDLATWTSSGDHDLVLASASLHWAPNHAEVLERWTAALRPGGQLAVQVPANAYMPSHTIADQVAGTEPFLTAFGAEGPPADPVRENVLEPERYARILYELGFAQQHVRLQIYPHLLASSRLVVEWVKGTTLTRFQKRLDPAKFDAFIAEYERVLLATIGDSSPYFFPFRRILIWGRLDGQSRN